ncbi:hypothetical protein KGD83_19710 [Nocardiopsis akebiae]|uniref:Integral membrane protein n=1 Tax=Nocardiopsis akebiae TaxID=2831968 RepID=A0ABX8BZE3_9ACTN|nr:hypothetical protein [Nocardiopsis akebiae]QUX27525.1 hypothetical protein KGD83_19710 [Nocardiopsis akebiae]
MDRPEGSAEEGPQREETPRERTRRRAVGLGFVLGVLAGAVALILGLNAAGAPRQASWIATPLLAAVLCRAVPRRWVLQAIIPAACAVLLMMPVAVVVQQFVDWLPFYSVLVSAIPGIAVAIPVWRRTRADAADATPVGDPLQEAHRRDGGEPRRPDRRRGAENPLILGRLRRYLDGPGNASRGGPS